MGLDAAYKGALAASKAAYERAEGIQASLDASQAQQKRLRQQIADVKAAGRSKLANFGGRPVVELVQARRCSCRRCCGAAAAGGVRWRVACCERAADGADCLRCSAACIHCPRLAASQPNPPPAALLSFLQMVKRSEAQFSRPPIGPVGQYLQLEDSRCGWFSGWFGLLPVLPLQLASGRVLSNWSAGAEACCSKGRPFVSPTASCRFAAPTVAVAAGP